MSGDLRPLLPESFILVRWLPLLAATYRHDTPLVAGWSELKILTRRAKCPAALHRFCVTWNDWEWNLTVRFYTKDAEPGPMPMP